VLSFELDVVVFEGGVWASAVVFAGVTLSSPVSVLAASAGRSPGLYIETLPYEWVLIPRLI
jgi:hypothetical protein